MLEFARDAWGLVFDAVPDYPDYRPGLPGAAAGGRSLQPRLFNVGVLGASAGVVLACGGFEWNAEMLAEHFGGRLRGRGSPPFNTRDRHRIPAPAAAAPADLHP